MYEKIISIVGRYVSLPQTPSESLYSLDLTQYGLDSLKTISLVLDLEDEFQVQFPDELLTFESMNTMEAINNILRNLIAEGF